MNDNSFYVYVHRRISDNLPFYVGKGRGKRYNSTSGRNAWWKRTVQKHGFYSEIVFFNLTEEESFLLEIDTIKEFRYFGYPLTNMTDGGEGSCGLKFTDAQRLNIAAGLQKKRYQNKIRGKRSILRQSAAGLNNHFSDKNVYSFVRLIDGLVVVCTRSELCEQHGADRDLIKKLFYKKNPRKSACGWKLMEVSGDYKSET